MTPPASTSFATKLFYGMGSIAYGVKDNGFSYLLLLFYNQVLGLPERWVGLALFAALVVDAISDPIVGHLSDNLHSRWGRRHPFLYASAIPVAISYWFLWNPPAGLSNEALFVYLLVVAIVVRTFITFYEIPSSSLVPELTDRYDERTSILGYRFFFGWWGGLTMSVLAFLVFLQPSAEQPVGVLNRSGYGAYGLAAAIVMLVAILVSALGTHATIPRLRRPPPKQPFSWRRSAGELRETLSNRSFLALLGAAIFGSLALGVVAALNVYFGTFFWELSSNQLSLLVLPNFLAAGLAVVLAPRLSQAYGKKPAAIAILLAGLVLGPAPIVLRLVGLFAENGSPALLPLLALFNTVVVTLFIAGSILTSSMVADVVEDSELTTGRRSEGVLFAAGSFVQKCVSGAGIFGSTVVLAAIGFPRDAKPGEVDPAIVRNLGLVYVPLLVGCFAVSIAFLTGYRIRRDTHEENLRRLARGDA